MKRLVLAGACVGLLLAPAPRCLALSLGDGLTIVERSGRDAARAAAQEQVLLSAEVLAGAPRRPSIDAYARENLLAYQPAALAGPTSIPLSETESFSFGVRARQMFYDFGRTEAGVRAAGLDVESGRLETALTRNRAALQFIQTYVRLLRADSLVALMRQEVARFEAHRDDTRVLLEAGTITEDDLLQAEVRLADAVQRRLQAENFRALVAARVNSLLTRPLSDPVEPEELPAAPAGPAPARLEDAVALAMQQRVELAQVRARIAATEARRENARGEALPQLFVAGGYDYTQNDFQEHEGNWSVAAGVDVKLWSGGVITEKVRQRERELTVLARVRDQVQDDVQLDVQDAFLALQTARSRVGATATAVGQAKENLRLQQLRFTEGVGTATDVLDAVSLATTAGRNDLDARYDVIDALARLDFAVGRDLVPAWGGTRTAGGEGRP